MSIVYPRIIIDTYPPEVDAALVADTFISLFGSNGEASAAIAEKAGGNRSFSTFGRIDYKAGLTPGTYYVRVRGTDLTMTGAYAIRVITSIDLSDEYPAAENWFFTTLNTSDMDLFTNPNTPYEPDDNPQFGGETSIPVPISIGGKLNRYLTAGDVDWVKLTLP